MTTRVVRPKVMEKRLKLAEELTENNGGKLPNPWKMIQQGHGGLYRYTLRHKKEFSHFKVEEAVGKDEKNGRSHFNVAIRDEHLRTARKLAQNNGGVLQDTEWLAERGFTRLASYVKTYPHVFKNLGKRKKNSAMTYKKNAVDK